MCLGLLIIFGLTYYSRYYDHGFNIGDEGSLVLIAGRLLDGELPFSDIRIGYGLMWYLPIVVLFKFTGISFIVARLYFLAMALMISLFAFLTIRKNTGGLGLAAVAGFLVLIVPGTLHKTYIPLLVLANMLCVSGIDFEDRSLQPWRILACSLVVAATHHIRPELGMSAAFILIAALTTLSITVLRSWWARGARIFAQLGILGAAYSIFTLPLLLLALCGGYLAPFLESLIGPFSRLTQISSLLQKGSIAVAGQDIPADAGRALARVPVDTLWLGGSDQAFAALTYAPLVAFVAFLTFLGIQSIRKHLHGRPVVGNDTLGLLALLGLAYSAFPQFFLFRPDINHLSQFMPGYAVLVVAFVARSESRPKDIQADEDARKVISNWRLYRLLRTLTVVVFVIHCGYYTWFGLHEQGAGSIALVRGRTERFLGANGVEVVLTPWENSLLTTVTRITEEHVAVDDFLLCFPYCPGFNVVTNRRTFLRRLYVDDSLLITDPGWQRRTVEAIRIERPPLVIVHNAAINRTEISRFKNWAAHVMGYLATDYSLFESSEGFEFYLRSDKMPSS